MALSLYSCLYLFLLPVLLFLFFCLCVCLSVFVFPLSFSLCLSLSLPSSLPPSACLSLSRISILISVSCFFSQINSPYVSMTIICCCRCLVCRASLSLSRSHSPPALSLSLSLSRTLSLSLCYLSLSSCVSPSLPPCPLFPFISFSKIHVPRTTCIASPASWLAAAFAACQPLGPSRFCEEGLMGSGAMYSAPSRVNFGSAEPL